MQKYLPAILTLTLIACGVWMFFLLFEQYEEETDVGYSKEAMLNPYLASQRFLKKNDVKVMAQTTVLDFNLIPRNDTVFLSRVDSMLLTESQIKKALAWVKKGGVLIVGVGKETEGHDSFLKRFDIDPAQHESKDSKETDNKTSEKINEMLKLINQDVEHPTYTVNLADRGQLSVQALDNIILNHPSIYQSADDDHKATDKQSYAYELTTAVSDDKGPRLLQFNYGKGELTVLSSTKLWQNKHIGEADHAFLLAYLLPKKSTLHFFYNVTAPPLWELLKRYFFELIIASSALLLLWLWQASLRVQGTKIVTDGQRRVFTEHLTASAEFLTSKKQYQSLLTPIKDDITAQMRILHPGYTQLDINTQASLIAQRTQMLEKSIQTWFDYTHNVKNQDSLINALKLGNAIRRKL